MQENSLIYERGDIVIIELPFSDATGSKLRPTLVVSNSQYNSNRKDVLLAKISGSYYETEWEIKLQKEDVIGEELKKDSYIDIGFITTSEKSLIKKKVGKLKKEKLEEVIRKLEKLFM